MVKTRTIGKVKRTKGYFAFVDKSGNVKEFKPQRGRRKKKGKKRR